MDSVCAVVREDNVWCAAARDDDEDNVCGLRRRARRHNELEPGERCDEGLVLRTDFCHQI